MVAKIKAGRALSHAGVLLATLALAGAGVVVVGHLLNWPVVPSTLAGAAVCFGLRLLAIRYGWNLPVARPSEGGGTDAEQIDSGTPNRRL